MTKSKRWLLLSIALLALIALLVRSIRTNPRWQAFDTGEFLRSLTSISPRWTLLSLAAIYATYLVRALRWRALMTPVKSQTSLWKLFSATVIGFAAIGIFGRAGEMVRPYLVARKENVPISGQVGVWVIERSFDMLTILVTAAFALGHLETAGLQDSPDLGRALHLGGNMVALSMLALGVLLLALRNFAEPAVAWLLARLRFLSPSRYAWVQQTLQTFLEGSRSLRSLRVVVAATFYSVAEWFLIAACYSAVFNSFSGGIRLSLSETLIFMGSVMAGSLVQIPGAGGGIQLASVLVLTELFGLPPELAAAISLLIWVFTFLAVVPPAALLVLYEGLSWRKLRGLSQMT